MSTTRIQDAQGYYYAVTAEELVCRVIFNSQMFTPHQLRTMFHSVQRELEKRNGYLSAFKGEQDET